MTHSQASLQQSLPGIGLVLGAGVGLTICLAFAGAPGIALKRLVALGYRPIVKPETFGVHGYSGPVAEGELERARRRGAELAALIPTA